MDMSLEIIVAVVALAAVVLFFSKRRVPKE
jgi:hypothetical protein